MCIRDSLSAGFTLVALDTEDARVVGTLPVFGVSLGLLGVCLLYTSDAADERSSVDLGGRRIIKKKTRPDLYHGMRRILSYK